MTKQEIIQLINDFDEDKHELWYNRYDEEKKSSSAHPVDLAKCLWGNTLYFTKPKLTQAQKDFKAKWEGKKMYMNGTIPIIYNEFDRFSGGRCFIDKGGSTWSMSHDWVEYHTPKKKKLVWRDGLMYVRKKNWDKEVATIVIAKSRQTIIIKSTSHDKENIRINIEDANGYEQESGESLTREVDCDE